MLKMTLQRKPSTHFIDVVTGRPEDSGISLALVQHMAPVTPVFGVCMGHQCIGQVWGARITRAPGGVMHGKSSMVHLSTPTHSSQPHILKACPCCPQATSLLGLATS